MAKLSGFQCDRCGAHYEKNTSKDTQGRTDHRLVGFGLLNTMNQIFRMDLCDECMTELQTWMDNPGMTICDIETGDPINPDDIVINTTSEELDPRLNGKPFDEIDIEL